MERRVLQEFIEIYRMEQSLWKVKSCHYNNKTIKSMAYRRLLMKLKELYPEADIDMVKKKINALRTNFRKELRKVEASKERCKQTGEAVYVPSLWYYDLFHFIADQESELKNNDIDGSIDVHDMLKVEMDENMYYEDESDENFDEEFQVSSPESQTQMDPNVYQQQSTSMDGRRCVVVSEPYGYKRKREMNYQHDNEWYPKVESVGSYNMVPLPLPLPSTSSDEYGVFGQYVAAKLEKMDKPMQMLSERLISEILFRGQMGSLNKNTAIHDIQQSVVNLEDSTQNA